MSSLFAPTVRVPGGRFKPDPPVPARDVARADRRVRRASGVLAALAVLLVIAWWVDGGGPVGLLEGGTSAVAETGRLCGLLSSLLLLGQVLLAARIPLLEHAFGQRHLIALHRGTGIASFAGVLAHVGCASWAHGPAGAGRVPAGFWELTWTWPGMAVASLGTVLVVLVVVTSARWIRTRLRYEWWHLLHLWGYAGVFLALPHQLWAGREFTTSPLRTVFWWGLWTAAVLAVAVWRVAVPVVRSRRHRITVAAVLPEGDGSVSVHMTGERLRELGASAGQFFVWRFRSGRGLARGQPVLAVGAADGPLAPDHRQAARRRERRRPEPAAGHPGLHRGPLRQAHPAHADQPAGRADRCRRRDDPVAGAGGEVPQRVRRRRGGAPLHPRAAVRREFTRLARERKLHVVTSPGPRRRSGSWFGADAGRADALAALRARIPDIAVREVYVCGPGRWTAMVRRTVLAAGVPERRVHVENFG
ncbi:ferric reductase-like transmembrane domain-containing protein [Pseudonocardia sp. ICBG601]|uniref:ferric reductase-like transmembrane domain-containing protein n=1 Tax=Pseudonocardia sp. ICBG601 TaxID=2846759 RepID=UPI001CF62041|nr:ferric reductase-like transmembrane domain-containing protein [Pseudonocardia sp. ICBG601]